jgi:hypothetical protein
MIGDIPIVTKVRPAGSRTLHVRFAGDRRAYVVALTGLIARSKHFAPLMEDADTFAKLDILDDGIGVAWPIETKWGPPRPFKFNAARDRGRAVADEGRGLFEMAKIFGSVTH